MAKKRKKKDEELITNCDNPEEVVANCDHLDEPVTNCDQSKELKTFFFGIARDDIAVIEIDMLNLKNYGGAPMKK
ncbi:MAG: hypothetical protein J6W05_05510 [Prevotella sp.]|nr:hypothetical protein [Prevotella sp.]